MGNRKIVRCIIANRHGEQYKRRRHQNYCLPPFAWLQSVLIRFENYYSGKLGKFKINPLDFCYDNLQNRTISKMNLENQLFAHEWYCVLRPNIYGFSWHCWNVCHANTEIEQLMILTFISRVFIPFFVFLLSLLIIIILNLNESKSIRNDLFDWKCSKYLINNE